MSPENGRLVSKDIHSVRAIGKVAPSICILLFQIVY